MLLKPFKINIDTGVSLRNFAVGEENFIVAEKRFYISIKITERLDSEKNMRINYKATDNWLSVTCRHAHVERAGKSGRFFDIFQNEMRKITFRHLKKCKNTTILWWARSRDLDGYQSPMTTGVLEL